MRRGQCRCAAKEGDVLSQTTDAASQTAAPEGGVNTAHPPNASSELLALILGVLDDNKAEDVISVDLAGKSEIADFMVICSGRSSRQVISLADKLAEEIKHSGRGPGKLEGRDQGDWVLIDAGDVIVHIFRPEVREFYQLEKMWIEPGQGMQNPG